MIQQKNKKAFDKAFGRAFGNVFGGDDFKPTLIADLLSWHDATDPSTILTGANPEDVTDWLDKSGNGHDLDEATAANQPHTGLENINGNNVLVFDGADDLHSISAFPIGNNLTIFIVGLVKAVATEFESILSMTAVGTDFQIQAGSNTQFLGEVSPQLGGAARLQSPSDLLGINELLVYRFSDGDNTQVLRVLGAQVDSQNFTSTFDTSQTLVLGANRNQDSFLECNIGEVIIYDRDLPIAEINKVESYLASKWKLTLA